MPPDDQQTAATTIDTMARRWRAAEGMERGSGVPSNNKNAGRGQRREECEL